MVVDFRKRLKGTREITIYCQYGTYYTWYCMFYMQPVQHNFILYTYLITLYIDPRGHVLEPKFVPSQTIAVLEEELATLCILFLLGPHVKLVCCRTFSS